jgi:hypothetical protein
MEIYLFQETQQVQTIFLQMEPFNHK